ncbi:acylating sulfoacetaldehyde dehydrogenase [Diaphorobacter caeni]|uniref:acylating sulfoacetaldehyde dehydrogenase n=1 Tax=Diaphorobacter caeni TaxID=2784387 RepID=UPI00188F557F|nr:aldehyde dehydrogenase family protein [Diaphorobacter caeni]MBF5003829.1 aldehyde dehydrogenase family protein [Diaphorobacter caeni]
MANNSSTLPHDNNVVAELVARARAAQRRFETSSQEQVDMTVAAAGWAIMEPKRNRELAELAVADTGVGNVEDKVRKNHRKTQGLLRDLQGVRSVGQISEDPEKGIIEIARPVGVVCAVTPSTNPGATPANKIINALKGRNAVIVAPSPKGWGTAARLIEFIHQQFDKVGAPHDLVQLLPAPVNKQSTGDLMRMCDLVVATGSQANVRAAYASGTPAFGVGAGNVASIVDETADAEAASDRILRSKTFDNATSCSAENSMVVVNAAADAMIAALQARGAVLLSPTQKATLQRLMWNEGRLSSAVIGKSATEIALRAAELDASDRDAWLAIAEQKPRILMVYEDGVGEAHPFSGEKLSPVLTVYRVPDFAAAAAMVERIYRFEGAGHSVSLHSSDAARAMQLGLNLPVSRVIVNQPHALATGGNFDNGLPFSLSMGCGTWGKNNFSDNMNWRHYVNITRIASPIAERVPTENDIFGAFFAAHGAH